MSAKKKAAPAAKASESEAPASSESTAAEHVAPKNVYRADLGESLPPQKPAGVE